MKILNKVSSVDTYKFLEAWRNSNLIETVILHHHLEYENNYCNN